jgi:hypothetical protein
MPVDSFQSLSTDRAEIRLTSETNCCKLSFNGNHEFTFRSSKVKNKKYYNVGTVPRRV